MDNKFEADKWYDVHWLWSKKNYIAKFSKFVDGSYQFSDAFYKEDKKRFGSLSFVNTELGNFTQLKMEEVYTYFPEERPKENVILEKGNIYVASNGNIFRWDTIDSDYYLNIVENYREFHGKEAGCFLKTGNRLATKEESAWLNACISANKFIPKEEALKPKVEEVPEYVECIKEVTSRTKIGKIYKSKLDDGNFKWQDDSGDWDYWIRDWDEHNKKFWKPSTKEAFEAQNKPKSQFEVGKWYKRAFLPQHNKDQFKTYFKCCKVDNDKWWASDEITESGIFNSENSKTEKCNKDMHLVNLSEIQQYLPEGHVDKIVKPKEPIMNTYGLKVGDNFPEKLLNAWCKLPETVWDKFKNNYSNGNHFTSQTSREILKLEERSGKLAMHLSGCTSEFWIKAEGFKEFMENFDKPKVQSFWSVRYCSEFTEEIFNHLLKWCDEKIKLFPDFKWRGHTNDRSYSDLTKVGYFNYDENKAIQGNSYLCGIDNNTQRGNSISVSELCSIINYKPKSIELTSLPEKWYCCPKSEEQDKILIDWRGGGHSDHYTKSRVCYNKYWANEKEILGYTEITFDQFKKWVLKFEEKPMKKKCEYEVVHCTTQEEWEFAYKKLRTDFNVKFQVDSDTKGKANCINILEGSGWGSLEWYKQYDTKIYSFSEWCTKFGHKMEPKSLVGRWFKALKSDIDYSNCTKDNYYQFINETDFVSEKKLIMGISKESQKLIELQPEGFSPPSKSDIPEYVECESNGGDNREHFTIGKIYKTVKQDGVTLYLIGDDFREKTVYYGLNHPNKSNKATYFKPSTKEAYEAQSMIKTESVMEEFLGFKKGDRVVITKYPYCWNSHFNNNCPSGAAYPIDCTIDEIGRQSTNIAMSAGGYGWDLDALIRDKAISKFKVSIPQESLPNAKQFVEWVECIDSTYSYMKGEKYKVEDPSGLILYPNTSVGSLYWLEHGAKGFFKPCNPPIMKEEDWCVAKTSDNVGAIKSWGGSMGWTGTSVYYGMKSSVKYAAGRTWGKLLTTEEFYAKIGKTPVKTESALEEWKRKTKARNLTVEELTKVVNNDILYGEFCALKGVTLEAKVKNLCEEWGIKTETTMTKEELIKIIEKELAIY